VQLDELGGIAGPERLVIDFVDDDCARLGGQTERGDGQKENSNSGDGTIRCEPRLTFLHDVQVRRPPRIQGGLNQGWRLQYAGRTAVCLW
jgi:hypothetical protein